MPEVGRARIADTTEAVCEVTRGNDSERADRGQHAALVPVDVVIAVSNADRLTTKPAREIHVADGDIARVARRSVRASRGRVALAAAARVGTPVVALEWGEVAGIEVAHRALHDTERVVRTVALGAPRKASPRRGVAPGRGDEELLWDAYRSAESSRRSGSTSGGRSFWMVSQITAGRRFQYAWTE